MEALHDHLESQHMDEFLRDIPSMLDGHVSTRRYEVRATEKSSIDKQVRNGIRIRDLSKNYPLVPRVRYL